MLLTENAAFSAAAATRGGGGGRTPADTWGERPRLRQTGGRQHSTQLRGGARKAAIIEEIIGTILTINVPLILKIIFFCGQITLLAISRDIWRGARLF